MRLLVLAWRANGFRCSNVGRNRQMRVIGRYGKAEASTPIYKQSCFEYTQTQWYISEKLTTHNDLLKSRHSWLYKSDVWFMEISNIYLDSKVEAIRHFETQICLH